MSLLARRTVVDNPAGGGGGFDRLGVTGLHEWWEASDLALSDTDPITTWAGASGSHTLSSISTDDPLYKASAINGLPSADMLTASDSCLLSTSGGISQPNTYFIVAKVLNNSSVLFDGGAGGRNLLGVSAGGSMYYFAGTVQTGSARDGNWHLWTCRMDGATSYMRRDGVDDSTANPGTAAMGTLCLGADSGAGSRMAGEVACWVVVDGGLSTAERDDVEDYLMTRYGL